MQRRVSANRFPFDTESVNTKHMIPNSRPDDFSAQQNDLIERVKTRAVRFVYLDPREIPGLTGLPL